MSMQASGEQANPSICVLGRARNYLRIARWWRRHSLESRVPDECLRYAANQEGLAWHMRLPMASGETLCNHEFIGGRCPKCGEFIKVFEALSALEATSAARPSLPEEAPRELKDCEIGRMLWPFPDHELGHRMRYAPQNLTPQEFMRAARELDAYAHLIALPQKRRNEICSQIQKGPNA